MEAAISEKGRELLRNIDDAYRVVYASLKINGKASPSFELSNGKRVKLVRNMPLDKL